MHFVNSIYSNQTVGLLKYFQVALSLLGVKSIKYILYDIYIYIHTHCTTKQLEMAGKTALKTSEDEGLSGGNVFI